MNDCPIERRKLVKTRTLNMGTGESKPAGEEWRVEPCGTPLFGKDAEAGLCRGCATGWSHPENSPTAAGMESIMRRGGIPPYALAVWQGDFVTNKGELPLWSGKGAPPAVGSIVESSGNVRHACQITGYVVEEGWLMAEGFRVAEPKKRGNLAGAEIHYPEDSK